MFIDRAIIRVEGGTGGSGCTSFRREWRTPMGGPDGGDGGRGGSVIVRGDSNLATLLDYTYRDNWVAERGEHGMGANKSGRSGADIVMPVPPGTILRDKESGEIVAEILEDGQEVVIAQGGRGGKGNAFFATPTHQSPREWQPGEEGVVRTLEMELKLIADIGLVGQPNAGKSTLLSVISAARPKIADYPFTTLQPNLGVVQLSDHRTFVVADIPASSKEPTKEGTRPPVPPPHRADPDPGLPDPDRRHGLAGRVRPAQARDRRVLARPRGQAALRRVHKDGPPGRGVRAPDRSAWSVRTFCCQRAGARRIGGAHRRLVDGAFAPKAKCQTAGCNCKSTLILGPFSSKYT